MLHDVKLVCKFAVDIHCVESLVMGVVKYFPRWQSLKYKFI